MAGDGKEILIVDDSPEDRAYLKHLLRKGNNYNWRFTEAETGELGVAAAHENHFDCIVLDQQLPDIKGLEVLERLRNAAGDLTSPIVLLTAMGDEALAASAIKAGALDYIPKKGLTEHIILRALQNAVQKFELIESRRNSEAELRRSQHRLTMMAETVPGILFTNRADGICEYVSQRFYEYTGLPAGADKNANWKMSVHPGDAEKESPRWQESIDRGEPYEAEFRLRRHDGAYRWFTSRVVPLHENGLISNWVGVSVDIHDLKEIRNALEERGRDLERSNEELQKFAYVISHDLQAPLRTVGTMTQLIVRRLGNNLDDDTQKVTALVASGVQRMSRLITDLMEYSRLSGQGEHALTSIDAGEVVNWALANLQTQIEESGAVISLGVPFPHVVADDQLGRVFQNILGNSIKYRGEKKIEIRIDARRDGAHWIFAVKDNGIGFEMKYADKIFGVFQRLHGDERYAGTGVGLAICKRIVERYGGRIWAESEVGEGTTFYFTVAA